MRILVADDDFVFRSALQSSLTDWGYQTVVAADGLEAWRLLQSVDAPQFALLDWMMPGLDGLAICRQIRATPDIEQSYLILLTARADMADVIAGLDSGADDYLVKPFDFRELRARVAVGRRVLHLKERLIAQNRVLEDALAHVKQLQGLLPICSYCKKIRDDHAYWHQVDDYIASRLDVHFSHGICPDCMKTRVIPEIEQLSGELQKKARLR